MQASTAHSEDSIRLKQRLRAELRRVRLRIIGHAGLILLGGVGLFLAAALLAARSWMSLGPVAAWTIWAVIGLAGGWVLFLELFLPLRRLSKLRGFSRELERHGDYGNLLEAATQFTSPRKDDPLKRGASPELVAEILRRARAEAEQDALAPRIPLVGVLPHTALALFVLLIWMALGWFAPRQLDEAWRALRHPSSLADRPPSSGLYSLSGDLHVPVGGRAELLARDLVGGDEAVVLEISFTGDYWQQLATETLTARPDNSPYLEVRGRVAPVEDPFRYRFRKGELVSEEHEVAIKERPVLRSLRARLEAPAYTGQPVIESLELGGTVTVLQGTLVTLRGKASVSLREARMLVEDGEARELRVEGNTFEDSLRVDQDMGFRVELVDDEGLRGEAVTVYRFTAIADDPPSVRITAPESDMALDRGLRVEIEGLAADDIGLRQVNLLYRTPQDEDWRSIALVRDGQPASTSPAIEDLQVDAGQRESALGFRWDLGEVQLFPGDALSYCLEAVDNNELVGGQRARSGVQQLRLPTVAQVLENQREQQDTERDELGGILQEGEKLQEDLERLRRELLKNPEPDWAKQQEIKEALKAQEALREQARNAAERMQSMLDEFQNNNAGSMELLEKMEVVQELLDSLQDDSLQEYMKAMEEALDKLNPRELQQAMEDAVDGQEEANRRLDRTIELLRQLERERTMGDLVEEASEYLARQEELMERLEELAQNGLSEENEAGNQEEAAEDAASLEEQDPSATDESQATEEDSGADQENAEAGDESAQSEEQSAEDATPSAEEGEDPSASEQGLSEEEVSRLQEQLAQETAKLEEQLREALDRLKEQMESGEADDPAAQEMQKALEEAMKQMEQEGQPSGSMSDAGDKLQQGEQQEASQEMQEAMKRLVSLYRQLSEGQEGMTQATQQFAVEKLQQTAYDLLSVSHDQETLVRSLDGSVRDQRMQPVTRKQARLLRGTRGLSEDLEELSKKNFMVGERLLASMRDLVEVMEAAAQQMEYSRPRRAHLEAETAMGMMNQIVIGLLTAAEQQGQGGGGGSASAQMQKMAGDQSRLNAMTEELRRKMAGGLSEAERRQLAQMRAMQEQLRRQLAELQKGMADEQRVLGDLNRIGEDMEKVARELEQGRLETQTRDLQDRILSRLLDAQRSIRERDFAKRRESREGDELYGEQEGSSLSEGRQDRRRELRRWLAPEKAPLEYQDEVRRYFRRIEDELEGKGDLP